MTTQDRRITKTRKAIYQAFLHLLNQKDYEAITVQEIIDLADVGRSTFYSHYESKELLLDELCQKLFHHLFERAEHLSPQDYLAHIFQHFNRNLILITQKLTVVLLVIKVNLPSTSTITIGNLLSKVMKFAR